MNTRICEEPKCAEPIKAKKLCATHYQQWWRGQPRCKTPDCNRQAAGHHRCRPHERLALTEGVPIEDQLERLGRFRSHIVGDFKTGCWRWTGPTNQDGYGTMQAKGMWLAHRYAYVWFGGGHEPKRELDHVCNTIACVRPDHLEPVTATRNNQLRHARALAGPLDYWRDSHRLPASLEMARWAVSAGLPCYTPNPRTGKSGFGDSISGVLILEPKIPISDGVWIVEPHELQRAA